MNHVGVNGLDIVFQRDALHYSFQRAVRSRLVRTYLVVPITDGLKLSMLISMKGMGCARDDGASVIVGAHRVPPCFMHRCVGHAVNSRCEEHGSSGGHVEASSWSYHGLEISPWE